MINLKKQTVGGLLYRATFLMLACGLFFLDIFLLNFGLSWVFGSYPVVQDIRRER